MDFETEYDEIIRAKFEYIEEALEDFGEISLVTDYDTAREIAMEYGCRDYEDYLGIDLQSDVEGYLVEIVEESILSISPIMSNGKYPLIEAEELTIDEDIYDFLDDDFYDSLNVGEVFVLQTEKI